MSACAPILNRQITNCYLVNPLSEMSTWDSLNNPYSSIKKKTGTHSVEHLTRPSIYEKNSVVVSLSNQSKYSGVPNKQAGSNKQAGRNFHEISIIKQVLINKQGGKIVEFQ